MKIKNFNKDYLEFLFPQRTRLLTEYSLTYKSSNDEIISALTEMMEKDYNMIKPFLLEKVNNILDIGCGIGLIDLALYKHYEKKPTLNLLDKTNLINEKTNIRGFNKEYVFYNSMDATKDTLISNGVDENNLKVYEVNESNIELLGNQKYDLIVSLLSCGWHYSIETYVDLIKKTIKDDGLIILDIRHNTGQLEYASENFKLLHTIKNIFESKHDGGTVGDRYVFTKK